MKTTLLIALSTLSLPLTALADDAPKAVTTQFETLLKATQNNDLEKFESVCDAAMQDAMTPEILAQVSKQVAEPMKAGYDADFMGDIDKVSHKTYYWKVEFDNDKSPELLAEMTVANGKVAGFFLR
ncbi:hypothetical protein [Rubritalea sp.]|uniref:hypothetical protein n=1 Tax=Rubritalea sp. TaxID=2109375 RepID=UPI003EF4B70C